jgi:hypothetical protein
MKENPYEKDIDVTQEMRDGEIPLQPGKEEMTFEEWLMYGISRHWNSPPICNTHDKFPAAKEDKCQSYLLLYKNRQAAEDMREDFRPAVWRHYTREHRWWNMDVENIDSEPQ